MGMAKATSSPSIITVSAEKALIADGNYAANEVMSESKSGGTAWTFTKMARSNGGSGAITEAYVIFQQTTAITPRLTLFLFDATPTSNLNDNAANTAIIHADRTKNPRWIDLSATEDVGGSQQAKAAISTVGGLPVYYTCAAGDDDLYGIVMTRDAITAESAGEILTIVLVVEQY